MTLELTSGRFTNLDVLKLVPAAIALHAVATAVLLSAAAFALERRLGRTRTGAPKQTPASAT
jgi:hypothetical protein